MDQVDYRANPSAGGVGSQDTHADIYGECQEGTPTEPYPDETFRWYDEKSEWNKPTPEQPSVNGWSNG